MTRFTIIFVLEMCWGALMKTRRSAKRARMADATTTSADAAPSELGYVTELLPGVAAVNHRRIVGQPWDERLKRPAFYKKTLDGLAERAQQEGDVFMGTDPWGRPVPYYRCGLTNRYLPLDAMEIGHKKRWKAFVKDTNPANRAEAAQAYNDASNLELQWATANHSHDFEKPLRQPGLPPRDEEALYRQIGKTPTRLQTARWDRAAGRPLSPEQQEMLRLDSSDTLTRSELAKLQRYDRAPPPPLPQAPTVYEGPVHRLTVKRRRDGSSKADPAPDASDAVSASEPSEVRAVTEVAAAADPPPVLEVASSVAKVADVAEDAAEVVAIF